MQSASVDHSFRDRGQLVDAVRARVARAYGGEPMRAEVLRELTIEQHRFEKRSHLAAVAGKQKIEARLKEMLAIVPRGGNQRNAAGQRLERADRRNAGQCARIRP